MSAQHLLDHTVHFLLAQGIPRPQLQREVASQASRIAQRKERIRAPTILELEFVHDLAGIVSHWFSEPQYIDATTGRPKPIPLKGRAPSLRHLVSKVYVRRRREVLKLIEDAKLFRRNRCGLYEPPSERLLLMLGEQIATLRAASLTANFLRTVLHNHKTQGNENFDRLVQVAVPRGELPRFRRFLADQGQAFMEAIDNYLLDRQAKKPGADTVIAGIHLYMHTRDTNR